MFAKVFFGPEAKDNPLVNFFFFFFFFMQIFFGPSRLSTSYIGFVIQVLKLADIALLPVLFGCQVEGGCRSAVGADSRGRGCDHVTGLGTVRLALASDALVTRVDLTC